MKKAYIITSAIALANGPPLTYSNNRTCFTTEDRLRHTIATIATMDMVSDNETTLYLLDMSDEWEQFKVFFDYQTNLKFISVKDEFPDIYNTVISHPNKSHCECLLLSTFMREKRQELLEYDYLIKMTGRYFIDGSFDPTIFDEYNVNKIFYKTALQFEWNDIWQYQLVDRRAIQGDNTLRQYSSVIFGWGKHHYDHFLDLFTGMAAILAHPDRMFFDIETLGYMFTRQFDADIIEVPWVVYGWDATNGRFLRY